MKNTIVITGASSGIGHATAKFFAHHDWNVIATMRHPEKATDLAALPGITTFALDVSDPQHIRDAVADITSSYTVDVVFNNAGVMMLGPSEGAEDAQLVSLVTTNLLGPIRVTNAFIPYFRERRRGLFINTTSLTALVAGPFMSVYSASKAGLERWSFAMNLELNQLGIRVKTVIPGLVNTDVVKHGVIVSADPYSDMMNKMASAFSKPEIIALACEPDDIAKVVFQAATDGNDQIRYLADTFALTSVAQLMSFGEETVQRAGSQQFLQ